MLATKLRHGAVVSLSGVRQLLPIFAMHALPLDVDQNDNYKCAQLGAVSGKISRPANLLIGRERWMMMGAWPQDIQWSCPD